jgi:hypothetical protein
VDQAGGGEDGTCQRGPPHEPHEGCILPDGDPLITELRQSLADIGEE